MCFDSDDLLRFKFHGISLNCSESYTDSPKGLKNKNATMNLKNNDGKCLQYTITNHENIF